MNGVKSRFSRGGAESTEELKMYQLDDMTGAVVDASVQIHKELGPGLLESVYEIVLARALERRGFQVERQKPVRFEYDGMVFEEGFRTDLLIENRVVVELKSLEKLAPVHSKQLLTYLRLMHLPVGLLINFGAATLKEGLCRIVNNLSPSASPRLRVNQSSRGQDISHGSAKLSENLP
jgi:GxxExxY protein